MVDRVFLGSGTHLLPSLAAWVIEQHADGEVLDCSSHLVVLPTGRARRRLEQLLLELAGDRQLVPPELTTPAGLLDRFLVRKQAYADELTSQLAWLDAIGQASPSTLKVVTGHDTPPTSREATALAKRLQRVLKELGGAGYTPGEALQLGLDAGLPVDAPRWRGLEHLWLDVQSILASSSRIDADVARREAIDQDELQIDGIESVSIVSADPTRLTGRLLRLLDSRNLSVRSIIHGDAGELSDDFDELGSVVLDKWEHRPIDLASSTMVTCERVDDQAAVILEQLADQTEQDGELQADQVTVVVPDDASVGMLVRELQRCGVPVPLAVSRGAEDGRIGRLLQVLGELLEENAARHLGDLIRHPDVEAWLIEQGIEHPVATWDDLWNRHLPRTLSELRDGSRAQRKFSGLLGPLLDLIGPLHGSPRPAAEWARPVMTVLGTLVSASDVPLGNNDEQALDTIQASMESQLDLENGPVLSACALIRLLVQQLQSGSTWRTGGHGISVIGWLDAHLDDAAELFITGLNEGILPSKPSVDAWLPDQFREVLGLDSERRRLARDSWLLHAILSHGRRVTLISARRTVLGEPLPPSRLLLRTSGTSLAQRVQDLFSSSEGTPRLTDWQVDVESESDFIDQPLPSGKPKIEHVSVTSFRRFLDDPVSFLLERDQRIRANEVETLESLNPAGFGSLVHSVLERWGLEEASRDRRTEDAQAIHHELQSILTSYATDRFGANPSPGLRVQIAIASHRLEAVASVQAVRAQQGWKVELVETSFGRDNAPLFPQQGGLPLHGKIDRVDFHGDQGYQALDYKTSSKVEDPGKTHRTRNGWKDLQLPLYRVLLKHINVEVPPDGLGYFHVPPDPTICGVSMASWSEADLEEAEDEARRIVRIITSGNLLAEVEASL